jgi:hypothetical protein
MRHLDDAVAGEREPRRRHRAATATTLDPRHGAATAARSEQDAAADEGATEAYSEYAAGSAEEANDVMQCSSPPW